MLMEPRRCKKEKPLFEKAREAIKAESADVALKNTGGLTVSPNGTTKFDNSVAKHHNNIGTLLIFVSAQTSYW